MKSGLSTQKVKIYSTWNTPNLTNNLQGIAMFLVIGKFLVYKVPSINIIPYTVFEFWEGFFWVEDFETTTDSISHSFPSLLDS